MSRKAFTRAIVAASGLLLATSCSLMQPATTTGTGGLTYGIPTTTGTPVQSTSGNGFYGGMMTGGGMLTGGGLIGY